MAKTTYYRALGYYEVTENEGPPISITQASDTALDLKMKQVILGGSSWIDFKVKGKYNGYLHNERIYVVNPLQLPQLSPAPNMFLNETHSLLGYVNGTLCNYNEFMVQENCRIISASHVPYKGPSTFYISKPYVVRHNLETGDEKKNLISSSTISVFGGVSGGANGIVTYSYIDETPVYDRRFHSVFLDMISGTIIHEENTFYDPKMGIYFNYLISDDGGYAYHQNGSRFYRINPNGLEVLFEFNYSLGVFLSFHPKNSGMAFFMEPITRAINIVNLNTETIDKTIQAPASGYTFKSYDPSTNYMVFTKDNARIIYFVNTETDQVTSLGALSDNYRLLNGVLFNSYGQYLKLFE